MGVSKGRGDFGAEGSGDVGSGKGTGTKKPVEMTD